jgi:hypothetical protein
LATTVATRMTFAAPVALTWQGLMFYEELGGPPPMLLRLLLPTPIRTEGRIADGSKTVKCVYIGGHLLKRITNVEHGKLYEFEITEQALRVGWGIRLLGGRYRLRELPGGRTEVTAETRYASTRRPRWLWKPLEAMVCGTFHRHLLNSMRRKIEST